MAIQEDNKKQGDGSLSQKGKAQKLKLDKRLECSLVCCFPG